MITQLDLKILIYLFYATISHGLNCESFQEELSKKKMEVIQAIGKRKVLIIEKTAEKKEIYRITQLLTIPGIGKTTVIKLSKILGMRFEYEISRDTCYRRRIC